MPGESDGGGGKPKTSPRGIRYVEEDGDVAIHFEDLAKCLLHVDPALVKDPAKRSALVAFQQEAKALAPAAQLRRAAALTEEMGATVPDGAFASLIRPVKGPGDAR